MVSKHFSKREARCKCGCGQMTINTSMVGLLEAIRARFMKPVAVHSWNRCPKRNKAVGGVDNSYHVQGIACDISIPGVKIDDIAREAAAVGADGIGIYRKQGFVHVDVRGKAARWEE